MQNKKLTGCFTFQEERITTHESIITCQDRWRFIPKELNPQLRRWQDLKVRRADVVFCFSSKLCGSNTAGKLTKNYWKHLSEELRSHEISTERITNTAKHSPDGYPPNQEIASNLETSKVHYLIQNSSPPLVRILSQINPVHAHISLLKDSF